MACGWSPVGTKSAVSLKGARAGVAGSEAIGQVYQAPILLSPARGSALVLRPLTPTGNAPRLYADPAAYEAAVREFLERLAPR